MPIYAYECLEHNRFEVIQSMFGERRANCPKCGKQAETRFSTFSLRSAEPITFLQELPGGRGYQVLDWKADSGISPKQGQPCKTAKEVAREEHQGVKEV